ncbi:MAG TPA: SRPBCC domain-containing protein [Polyangiales bacterium]|nr:SRPBCC domain-containing protein [Polyangiales bacterium]
MMNKSRTPARRITMERTFAAPLEDIWELWTTKDGIEQWWGPEGFVVEVRKLELRPGGELHYAMIAKQPEQIAFMKQAGMPLVIESRITFTQIVRLQKLAYTHLADFIPGVEPYDVATTVELRETQAGVQMILSFDAMHEQLWTDRAVAGWESELGKLGKVIERAGLTVER